MAWEELDFDKPHLAYMIIGGFTSLFMLCSLFIKEKLYIGEATIATLVGVIFGPHAAGLFDPLSWGNTDKITLELSRIVLVVQCFAVGVELPKAYMERHWRSVTFLLVPVMTLGWLVTSLIIWICVAPLSWLESLAVAACVTATDPVLASSVVGKGKFAKRVPKHLRDILSAESGCNDGMAFPFIYLSYYLIHYHLSAGEVTFHWFLLLILYECIFGAIYGFIIGYIGRHAIKMAERNNLIDRDSFLVFYFVLALFCSGSAAGLGLDDLLVGFAAGVGFSNDGWFTAKTEESHVSNVIDLLLNLSYFVYLGAIIPWEDYNNPSIGLTPWRLVLIAIFVILFRRIPAMMAFKPLIPDVKNWREALFAGHFGPIGVGAIFAAILLRAELEQGSTQPLAPDEIGSLSGTENFLLIETLWPIVTFLVISSILVHGSSIAVFTLGKRINTLTLTMSYTQGNDANWMDRLPRIASRGRSMSRNSKLSEESSEEKADFQPGTLGPIGVPRNFLRRQKEEEYDDQPGGGVTNRASRKKRKHSAGGPIDESAFGRQPYWERQDSAKQDEAGDEGEPPDMIEAEAKADEQREIDEENRENQDQDDDASPEIEAYREGHQMIVEDEEGNVLDARDIRGESEEQVKHELLEDVKKLRAETSGEHAKNKRHPHEKNEGEEFENHIAKDIEHPQQAWRKWLRKKEKGKDADRSKEQDKPKQHRGPAQAYQYGDKIIVEDADGEVVKTYDIPRQAKPAQKPSPKPKDGSDDKPQRPGLRQGLSRVGTWTGLSRMHSRNDGQMALQALADAGEGPVAEKVDEEEEGERDEDDRNIRFRVHGTQRRMSKQDFIKQIQSLDPKLRVDVVDQVNAPEDVKKDVRSHAEAEDKLQVHAAESSTARSPGASRSSEASRSPGAKHPRSGDVQPALHRANTQSSNSLEEAYIVDSHGREIPIHDVQSAVARASEGKSETAAQRRRRLAADSRKQPESDDSEDDGRERVPPVRQSSNRKELQRLTSGTSVVNEEETAAERKRRLAALGQAGDGSDSDSDDDDGDVGARQGRAGLAPREPSRALIRDRVSPQSPIAEEEEGQNAEDTQSADVPKSPGIRFADMPRGEGGNKARRFGRSIGMRRG